MACAASHIVGIVVGGGPAPGINGVIAAVTNYSVQRGYKVLGIMEGFKWLLQPDPVVAAEHTLELNAKNTETLHMRGGTIIHTSRLNPTKSAEHMTNVVNNLKALGISFLVTIGGDDTAHSSVTCAKRGADFLKVVHVPKTIDNDLPLPGNLPTFGYTTAVQVGSEILTSMMADARSTLRWYLIEAMGRQSGSLALGMSAGAGAQLCIIPEQFNGKVTLDNICDIVESTMYKRDAMGLPYGIIVLAEGLCEYMDETECQKLCKGQPVPLDPHGHIRLDKINLALGITNEMERRFSEKKLTPYGLTFKKLGYELRCHDPVAFDIEYTRQLGYGAMNLLELGMSGKMIIRTEKGFSTIDLEKASDPVTGKVKVRAVDCSGIDYQTARGYMSFLETSDLETGKDLLKKMAAVAKITPEEFQKKFASVPSLFPKTKFVLHE